MYPNEIPSVTVNGVDVEIETPSSGVRLVKTRGPRGPRTMGIKTAYRRATKLWGENAVVTEVLGNGARCRVGVRVLGWFRCRGVGESWEQAFGGARR